METESKFAIGTRVKVSPVLFFNGKPRTGVVVHRHNDMVYVDIDGGMMWEGFNKSWLTPET